MSTNGFIFDEKIFESENFDAKAFVTKYRNISSLESLKGELEEYREHLNSEVCIF